MRNSDPIHVAEPDVSPAQMDLPEHLRFYQLCGIIAACISVLVTVFLYLTDADVGEQPLLAAFVISGPVTLVLLLGGIKYPRLSAWLLLLSFSGGVLYLYSQGVQFNLVITILFTCFYLFGAVAATERYRAPEAKPFWLAGRLCRNVVTLLLLAIILSLCSSGYLLRWMQLKKDNPLQWVQYRQTMIARYIDSRPRAELSTPAFALKKVRLENKSLVFVYRVAEDSTMGESQLARYARKGFLPHCSERGIRDLGMKVMYVFHQGQTEKVFVFDEDDCVVPPSA